MLSSPTRPLAHRRRAALATALLTAGALLVPTAALAAEPAAPTEPAAQPRTAEVTGTLVRAVDEGSPGGGAGTSSPAEHSDVLLAWVGEGAEAVRVPAEDVEDLPTGATVEVQLGRRAARDADEPDGLEPAREVLAAQVLDVGSPALADDLATSSLAATTPATTTLATTTLAPAAHSVTVVMAVPAGGRRDAATLAQVTNAVTGPVSAFWSGQTGGAVTFAVTGGTDWVDLAAGCSDPSAMWAEAAQRAGFTPGPDRHLLLHLGVGDSSGCSAGLATVGGSPSQGGAGYVTSVSTSLLAHELGHNLGLYHSAKLRCPSVVEASSGCSTSEYFDLYDVMGGAWSQVGSLSAHQAHRLGSLPPSEGVDVAGEGGRYTIAPIAARGRVRAVRLRDGASTYWVELRAATGQDSWLSTSANTLGLESGVVVRREVAGPSSYSSLLLDPTPSTAAEYGRDLRSALLPGASTTISGGRWRLSVGAVSAGGTSVTITPTSPGITATPDGELTGAPTPAPGPLAAAAVTRREGADRYGTAVAVSSASHPGGAPTVVVASGEAFPDALAAGPVAARSGGPLLLVPRTGQVPAEVLAELRRLAPAGITLAGGPSAVDEGVAAQLAALAPLTRTSGADRFDTAARLSESTGARGGTVYLASGATHADAVAGAALAARTGGTVLLAGREGLPPATSRALTALAPTQVVVLGGSASLGTAVEDGVRTAVPGAEVSRRAGADRYETAALVARAGYPDGARTVYLALGDAFPDALAGGPAAGRSGAPLLLTQRGCVPQATLDQLVALSPDRVVILGGPAVVTADVEAFRSC